MTAKINITQQLSRNRLHEEIENILLTQIISGEIAVGQKLPTERSLAQHLNVNRSTVRTALSKLESLDLIDIRHGDGAYVKDYLNSGNLELIRPLIEMGDGFNSDLFMNLMDLRRIMVPELAAAAALHYQETHLQQLEEIINDDTLPMMEKDLQLHHVIARASGNLLYLFVLNFFNKFFREFGAELYFANPENCQRSAHFHRQITDALRQKDPEAARRIMVDVLLYAEQAIEKTLPPQGS